MSGKDTTDMSWEEMLRATSGADWRPTEAVEDDHTEHDDSAAPDWTRAALVAPEPKKMISVRLDADVLDYFKAQGRGYQTRMNAVLRSYMSAKKDAG